MLVIILLEMTILFGLIIIHLVFYPIRNGQNEFFKVVSEDKNVTLSRSLKNQSYAINKQ